MEKLTGVNVQELAEPANTFAAESGAGDISASENNSVAESAQAESAAAPKQSKEQNAKYAAMRRQSQAQARRIAQIEEEIRLYRLSHGMEQESADGADGADEGADESADESSNESSDESADSADESSNEGAEGADSADSADSADEGANDSAEGADSPNPESISEAGRAEQLLEQARIKRELQSDPEYQRLQNQLSRYRDMVVRDAMQKDLSAIRAAHPEAKLESLEALGEEFSLLIGIGWDAVDAFEAVQLKLSKKQKMSPESTGSVKSNELAKEKEHFTPEEVDKLSAKDFDKDPSLLGKVERSMTRWRKKG